ncbi:60S ribosomal protein L14-1 [Zea mays]|uniref:60S ribosomal protein L14-1 n=1 Tax=Zea mays TaxID=4577 RepID=A0A1D6Q2V8_MAIZE|nr:60S ribosomal protein L14-1 [Zea mays]
MGLRDALEIHPDRIYTFSISFVQFLLSSHLLSQLQHLGSHRQAHLATTYLELHRALVDAPDMVKCQINFKRLSLTDIKIDIKSVPKKTTRIKAMEEADVKTKWENSSWGKKLIV